MYFSFFLNFKVDVESKQKNKDKTQTEISLKNLKFFKEEGISLAERECFWQAIGRWDEALEIKVPEKSAIELEHEKILEMKAQVLSTLHEWELAIGAKYLGVFLLSFHQNERKIY
jgi:hypothetical protein